MKTKDLFEINKRMQQIIDITRSMATEKNQIKLMDMRLEITKIAGGTQGIIEFYLTKEGE